MTRLWVLWACAVAGCAVSAAATADPVGPADAPAVVVFSRHTFRGVGLSVAPPRLDLAAAGLGTVELPLLGYGMEATEHGLELARRFGAPAIDEATGRAVETLGSVWNHRWDEVRCDLSCSRDFFTGLYFRAGLQPNQSEEIVLSGVPTVEGKGVDAVTIGHPIRELLPIEAVRRLESGTPGEQRLAAAGDALLQTLARALGWAPPRALAPRVTAQGSVRKEYAALTLLTSSIEMAAAEGPPLRQLFPQADPAGLAPYEATALQQATRYLGALFVAMGPREIACASAVIPTRFIESVPAGRHVILASHDSDISLLLRALELVSDDDPDALSIKPMDSVVFALDPRSVCVVRTSMVIDPSGCFPGSFHSRVIWSGTREQWAARVQRVAQVAERWEVARAARARVPLLPAAPLDVRYRLQPAP